MNHRVEFKAMGCRMVALVDSPSQTSPELLQQVPNWFEEWEQCLSRFRPESELSRLNRSAGWPVAVSETFWQVFQAAQDAEQTSNRLVTPAVLGALVAAGYDRSFEALSREREMAPLGGWGAVGSLDEVTYDESTRSICLPSDVQLDFGGLAKGWAADQAARRLSSLGAALVSAGGDIAISAAQSDGALWPVGVDDPFHPGESLETLMLGGPVGVATSGTDYRRWKQGGRWSHHIIDPRTGLPAQTDIVTATVVAPTALEAEIAAKVVLISGSERGLDWLEARSGLAGMLLLENGEQVYSQRMGTFLWRGS